MKQNLVASSQESVASNSPWQQVWFGRFLSKLLDESWARKRDRHGFFGGWDVIHSEKKSHDMTMEKQPPFEDAFPISVCVSHCHVIVCYLVEGNSPENERMSPEKG